MMTLKGNFIVPQSRFEQSDFYINIVVQFAFL